MKFLNCNSNILGAANVNAAATAAIKSTSESEEFEEICESSALSSLTAAAESIHNNCNMNNICNF